MSTKPELPTRLITVNELSSMLSMSRRTIERLVAAGELPKPLKIGRSTRFVLAEIDRYINHQARRAF